MNFLSTLATDIIVVIMGLSLVWFHYYLYNWYKRIHFGNEEPKYLEDVKGSPRMYLAPFLVLLVDVLLFYFIFLD